MIDFGLAKRFICLKTDNHIKCKRKHNFTGTMRYCSATAHRSFEQSRKDDLISLAHIFIYLANEGELPWIDEKDSKV